MSEENNKKIIHRLIDEVWNNRNLDEVTNIFAEDFVGHSFTETIGAEAEKEAITRTQTAFPDVKLTIHDIIAEGDKVVTKCTQLKPFGSPWKETSGLSITMRSGG